MRALVDRKEEHASANRVQAQHISCPSKRNAPEASRWPLPRSAGGGEQPVRDLHPTDPRPESPEGFGSRDENRPDERNAESTDLAEIVHVSTHRADKPASSAASRVSANFDRTRGRVDVKDGAEGDEACSAIGARDRTRDGEVRTRDGEEIADMIRSIETLFVACPSAEGTPNLDHRQSGMDGMAEDCHPAEECPAASNDGDRKGGAHAALFGRDSKQRMQLVEALPTPSAGAAQGFPLSVDDTAAEHERGVSAARPRAYEPDGEGEEGTDSNTLEALRAAAERKRRFLSELKALGYSTQ
uniref:Uncharacterized protein n=1 Tax=Tetraselmis sp. GSL018 TaxID=582737 RepID=A0A061RNU7_9CHLO